MTEPPKLVVDNSDDDSNVEPLVAYCQEYIELMKLYPEIISMIKRATKTKDMAMQMALIDLQDRYSLWKEIVAEDNRNELHVVDKGDT